MHKVDKIPTISPWSQKNLAKAKIYPKLRRPLKDFELPIPEQAMEQSDTLAAERNLAAVFLHHVFLDLRPVRPLPPNSTDHRRYHHGCDLRNYGSAVEWLTEGSRPNAMSLELVASLLRISEERIRKAASRIMSGEIKYSYTNLRF